MNKPWEIRLPEIQIGAFKHVLKDLKERKVSSLCPFDQHTCDRDRPRCGSFVKGLRRNDGKTERVCPCYKFRTKSLIRRIEALLRYNKEVILNGRS